LLARKRRLQFIYRDNDKVVRKFYAAANAMRSHVKFASEMSTLFFLMETFCLSLLEQEPTKYARIEHIVKLLR